MLFPRSFFFYGIFFFTFIISLGDKFPFYISPFYFVYLSRYTIIFRIADGIWIISAEARLSKTISANL